MPGFVYCHPSLAALYLPIDVSRNRLLSNSYTISFEAAAGTRARLLALGLLHAYVRRAQCVTDALRALRITAFRNNGLPPWPGTKVPDADHFRAGAMAESSQLQVASLAG